MQYNRSSTKVFRGVRRPVWGDGFQPSSNLSMIDGWWAEMWWNHVPDGCSCNMKTPSAEGCSCRRAKHVVAFCRTKICPTRDAGDWDADDVKIGRTVLMDTAKCRELFRIAFAAALWAKEACCKELHICQHQRPNGQQCSEPSQVDEWLVRRHCTERRCSSRLDWRWMWQLGFAEPLTL